MLLPPASWSWNRIVADTRKSAATIWPPPMSEPSSSSPAAASSRSRCRASEAAPRSTTWKQPERAISSRSTGVGELRPSSLSWSRTSSVGSTNAATPIGAAHLTSSWPAFWTVFSTVPSWVCPLGTRPAKPPPLPPQAASEMASTQRVNRGMRWVMGRASCELQRRVDARQVGDRTR